MTRLQICLGLSPMWFMFNNFYSLDRNAGWQKIMMQHVFIIYMIHIFTFQGHVNVMEKRKFYQSAENIKSHVDKSPGVRPTAWIPRLARLLGSCVVLDKSLSFSDTRFHIHETLCPPCSRQWGLELTRVKVETSAWRVLNTISDHGGGYLACCWNNVIYF